MIFKKNYIYYPMWLKTTFLALIILEIISFVSFKIPVLNIISFFVILLTVLILSLRKLEFGIFAILIELIIGSKGYLFSLDLDGISISIRIALWLIVMSVWLTKICFKLSQGKTKALINIFTTKSFKYFIPLFIFIIWSFVNALLRNNAFNNIFDDFNAWLFFLLLFPSTSVFLNYNYDNNIDKLLKKLSSLSIASLLWLGTKTLLLLYIFSHHIYNITPSIYKWVRDTGVGEITQMQGGFYRIFFQSHIFALLAFLIIIVLLIDKLSQKPIKLKINLTDKYFFYLYFLAVWLLSVTLISFSRSNWLGLVSSLLLIQVLIFISYSTPFNIKKIMLINMHLVLILGLSIILIIGIVKFPYPNPIGGFSTTNLFTERASQVSGEAGVSSRWNLLPELFSEIKKAPILGKGFGATVTYISSDPRVLKSSPTGEYETYAFEWGWLDIWLKFGILGLLSYLYLLFGIIFKTNKNNFTSFNLKTALALSLITVSVVSFFSPYLNHPLGIGFLIFSALIIEFDNKPKDLQNC